MVLNPLLLCGTMLVTGAFGPMALAENGTPSGTQSDTSSGSPQPATANTSSSPSTPGSAAAPAIPRPDLPERLYVSHDTFVVTWDRLYALVNGRIWWKLNPDRMDVTVPKTNTSANVMPSPWPINPTAEWQLLGDTGLPFGSAEHPVQTPDTIVAISADEDFITAVDASGYLYHFQGNVWTDLFGLPSPVLVQPERLRLPDHTKAWALSVRHRHVQYYEDILGNQFNWGAAGCTSFYTLDQDGQQLRHGDPWFPPDFSRQMCGPKRGAFVAENLSSSASTTFLIGKNGTLYTRFYDYDSNGGTPFFRYRYGDAPRHSVPGTDPASEKEIRALPPEDWREEPGIPLSGKARLARNISILQTGLGNHARELRVQGLSASGLSGYYHKMLDESAWSFMETGESIRPTDLLPLPSTSPQALAMETGSTRDRSMVGRLVEGSRPDRRITRVEIPDFNFHCSPFALVLHLSNGQTIPLFMHAVDAWTLFKETDPEVDPFAVKRLKGTLEIPPEILASKDSLTQEILRSYFLDSQQTSFAWAIISSRDQVRMFRVRYLLGGAASNFEIQLTSPMVAAINPRHKEVHLYSDALASLSREDETAAAPPGPVDPVSGAAQMPRAESAPFQDDAMSGTVARGGSMNVAQRNTSTIPEAPRTEAGLMSTSSVAGQPLSASEVEAITRRLLTLDARRTALIQSREELEYRRTVSRGLLWGLPAATGTVDLISVLTTARFTLDSITTLTSLEEHMPSLLSSTRQGYEELYENSAKDYRKTLTTLEKTICQDAKLLARQQGVKVRELVESHPDLPGWMARGCR